MDPLPEGPEPQEDTPAQISGWIIITNRRHHLRTFLRVVGILVLFAAFVAVLVFFATTVFPQ